MTASGRLLVKSAPLCHSSKSRPVGVSCVLLWCMSKASESTALHIAAAGGHADVVHHLIEIGAAVDEENTVKHCLFVQVR